VSLESSALADLFILCLTPSSPSLCWDEFLCIVSLLLARLGESSNASQDTADHK
jgi:hypothetical protein